MSPFGNGRCSHCEPAESRRWRSGKGGRFFATPPRQRRRHVGLIGPVPRRGGGGGGGVRGGCGCGDASHSDPDLGSNGRCRLGDGLPPEDGLWLGRSPGLDGPSGPSGGVLLGGTRRVPGPTPIPGDSLAAAGHTVVQRRNSEDYEEALAEGRRRGRSGSDPRRLFGRAELWICQGWIRRSSVPIALTGPALTTPPG